MKRDIRAIWLALAAAAVAWSIAPGDAPAEGPADERDIVIDVRVEGNQIRSTESILATIKTRPGQQYSQQLVQADERRLLETRRFAGVVATKAQTPSGIVVTFRVQERPAIASIRFEGNKHIRAEELRKELTFGAGDPLYPALLRAGKEAIEARYRSAGYAKARVEVDEAGAMLSREVVYKIVEGPLVRIRKIRIKGNDHFGTLKLKLQVRSNSRIWPIFPGRYDPDQVAQDVEAIRRLYLEEGFLEVKVDALPRTSADQKNVELTFVIDEGPRFRVNDVLFEGNTVFSGRQLAGRMSLERGDFVKELQLKRDVQAVENAYGELGYIQSRVTHRLQYLPPDAPPPDWAAGLDEGRPALVNIVMVVRESDRYDVGRVIIRGNDLTKDHVIRRHIGLFPEKRFNMVAMRDSRLRLMETTLFEDVSLKPIGDQEGYRDLLVEVTEGRTANFIIGIGANSNTGVIGNISFTQRNFDLLGWPGPGREFWRGRAFKGAGQRLTVSAEPGTDLSRFNVSWFEPSLFDKPYSLDVNAYLYQQGRESYDIERMGLATALGHRFKNRWYGEIAPQVEWVELDADFDAPPEVAKDDGDHFMPSLKGTLVRDRTDSRWLPSTGDRFSFSYEHFVGDYNFGRAEASYRIYRTVFVDVTDRKHIVAGRVTVGQIFGGAPVFERYYGGGLGSIRGFEYRGISPRSRVNDDPIGGESMVLVGGEYSYPILGDQLRGVLFVDTGTVDDDLSLSKYRASVGFGFRWTIPFFGPVPLSLDFGFPIAKEDEDDTQVFSFTLGWQF